MEPVDLPNSTPPSDAPPKGQSLGDLFSGLAPDTLDMLLKGILAAKAKQAAATEDVNGVLGEQAEGEPPMPMDPDAGSEGVEHAAPMPLGAFGGAKLGKGFAVPNPADFLSGKGSKGSLLRAKAASRLLGGGKSKQKKNGGKGFFAGGKGGKGLTLKAIGVK